MTDQPVTEADAPNELDRMLQEAQSLLAACGKAGKLMDSQAKAIEDKDLETLEAILRQKQPFIDQLLGFKDLKAAYDLYRSSCSVPDTLASAYRGLEDNIKTLAQADQESIKLLKERHEEMARDLQLLMRGREAASCYSQPLQQQPRPRIDISG